MTSTNLEEFTASPLNSSRQHAKGLKVSMKKARKDAADMAHQRLDPLIDGALGYASRAGGQLKTFGRTAADRAMEKPALSAVAILGVGLVAGVALAAALRRPASGWAETAMEQADRLRSRLRH